MLQCLPKGCGLLENAGFGAAAVHLWKALIHETAIQQIVRLSRICPVSSDEGMPLQED